jgi:ribosomal-protein-alanine N-acetyltransferase
MEHILYEPRHDTGAKSLVRASTASVTTTPDWRTHLPVLRGQQATLRELRLSDAPSLLALLTTEEVARFISPLPTTVEGFERFTQWTHAQRAAGQYVCFAVVPHGQDAPVGIFQVRALEAEFRSAEWGFVLGAPYWGLGLFAEGAEAVMSFAFETLGVYRLEARAVVENGRGNGALQKIGAACEGRLRQSFLRHGRHYDQYLWAILADDRLAQRPRARSRGDATDRAPLIIATPRH